jgi:uncharacterized protein (DUF1800 family)
MTARGHEVLAFECRGALSMPSSPDRNSAALVLSRFGLGARPGDIELIAADPKGALGAEIAQRTLAMPASPDLVPTPSLLQQLFAFYEARNKALDALKVQANAASSALVEGLSPSRIPIDPSKLPYPVQRVFLAEVKARFAGTIHEPRVGFGERLAMFFANHFAISSAKGENVRILSGAFEREAIRPYVYGKFADMLLAVETHPAMLIYLDNQLSVGPASQAGRASKRGLNENLARETLELHTLGVDGGYSQADVTSLARIITGWTLTGPQGRAGVPGTFVFNAGAHEPATRPCSIAAIAIRASAKDRTRSWPWRAIRRPPGISPRSSSAISWPTNLRKRRSIASPRPICRATAI